MSYVGKNQLHRKMLLGRALRTRGFGDAAIDPAGTHDFPLTAAVGAVEDGDDVILPSGDEFF